MTDPVTAVSSYEARQAARLDAAPELYKREYERLCLELACNMGEPAEIFAAHGITIEQAAELTENAALIAMLERITKEVRENGLSFRMKARSISESLLPHGYNIATDPETSAAVRADLIKWFPRVAGLEPKEKVDETKHGGLTLSITFAGQAPQQVVSTREPILIEQET